MKDIQADCRICISAEPKELGRALTEDFYCACLNFIDDQNDRIAKYTFYCE